MFYQIFFSPQVKRSPIISNKHGIYELPHELKNDIKLRILGNKEISEKSQNLQNNGLISSYPGKIKILLKLATNSWKSEIKLFPYWAISHENELVSNILWTIVGSVK